MKKFFTLLAVAAMAIAAQAETLTVCDNLYYANYSPICGLYTDTEGTMTQSIYPADMLADMKGGTISEVTFYTVADYYINNGEMTEDPTDYINFENATIQLAFMEVDELGFTEVVAKTGATPVATVVPEYGSYMMTFTLDEPFEYTGKNLLVEVTVIEAGEWGQTYFLGNAVEDYNCAYYSINGEESIVDFLPKVTFTYTEGGDVPPVVEDDYKLVVVDQFGVEHVFDLNKGADGNYTTTLTLDYNPYYQFAWDYSLTEEENKAAHPVPFYFLVNGQRYGAEGNVATVLGYAMENPLNTEDGFYTVPVGYAYNLGLAIYGDEYYVYAAVANKTGVNELVDGKAVAGVRYFNMAGQEMKEANGMTIVVTTYTDGTTSAVKVVK